jgi:hypothetical protein
MRIMACKKKGQKIGKHSYINSIMIPSTIMSTKKAIHWMAQKEEKTMAQNQEEEKTPK